ncbi:MAG: hypothetical protein ACYDAP_02975 [Thermoplasmataceae archaeon]|jgi:hypothetical protein
MENHDYGNEWLKKNYPEYVKEANGKNATIIFHDESGVKRRPDVRGTWSLKEKRVRISITPKRKILNSLLKVQRKRCNSSKCRSSLLNRIYKNFAKGLYFHLLCW